ncbi:BgTH12-02936 [Blumeria graminis f. sp. triticale]|uniref:BgTH12-02936 n=1 Tax=Blumeria graminis f. sp. triticale TaxID=1689686 RepID=A0A9W4D378_BLUGR|nr:BgTH12-02936 [Blumeria graminis f. sp. triticale]
MTQALIRPYKQLSSSQAIYSLQIIQKVTRRMRHSTIISLILRYSKHIPLADIPSKSWMLRLIPGAIVELSVIESSYDFALH